MKEPESKQRRSSVWKCDATWRQRSRRPATGSGSGLSSIRPFILWLLSSVLLAGLTGAFANFQKNQSEQMRRADIERRLNTEIGNRVSQALAGLRLDVLAITNGSAYKPVDIYNSAASYLNNSFITFDPAGPDSSVYPEYAKRSFRSLVFELSTVVDPSVLPGLREAVSGYEELADRASARDADSTSKSQKEDASGAVDSLSKLLTRRIFRPEWHAPL